MSWHHLPDVVVLRENEGQAIATPPLNENPPGSEARVLLAKRSEKPKEGAREPQRLMDHGKQKEAAKYQLNLKVDSFSLLDNDARPECLECEPVSKVF